MGEIAAMPEGSVLIGLLKPFEDKARLAALKAAAEQSVERIVRLMVVFIVQTCLLPLLSAWLLWRLLRAAVAPRA